MSLSYPILTLDYIDTHADERDFGTGIQHVKSDGRRSDMSNCPSTLLLRSNPTIFVGRLGPYKSEDISFTT